MKTVETHLARAYGTLGVRDRAGMTAALATAQKCRVGSRLPGAAAPRIVGAMHRRSLALATASGGAFLGFLDTTIVNVSFPDVAASFAAPDARRSRGCWTRYFIVFAALLVPAGALADRYGRKRLFLAGVAASCSPARCARWRRPGRRSSPPACSRPRRRRC